MNRLLKYVLDKDYRFLINADRGFYNHLNDEEFVKRKFRAQNKVELDLQNPVTYNEKLQWLKIHDHNPEYIRMVNKVTAKDWIRERIGEEYLIPTLGVYDSVREIRFEDLPEQFVIKCAHASGANIICRDKKVFDWKQAKQKIRKWQKKNWFWYGREWPYLDCDHQIIVEKYMVDENDTSGDQATTDYKYFCFDGVPKLMYISKDKSDSPRTDFFDMDYNRLPIRMKDPNSDVCPDKPRQFEKMKELATVLSAGFPHLRVDFYVFGDKIYVGELTLYHCSGFSMMHPEEWNKKIGSWLTLPKK